MLETQGEERIVIQEDSLLTITSKNEKSKTSLSIFIKCIEVDHLRLSVSIFNKEIDDYIPIESISKNKEIFAVYLSDVVKVEWVCKPGTTLIESRMGKLNNIGVHNFVCLEKISLNFEMHISNTITHQGLEFYPVSRDGGDLEEIPFQVNKNKAIKSENMELKSLQKEASFLTRMLSIFSSKK
jgi:hypothetical protein